jgi:meso-butanediol dehydrogenase/(S,S)-butanediol dehydrogenase/diacetyl reductase
VNLGLEEQVVLIVGAGAIGRAAARLAAEEGATICAVSRSRESCDRCCEEVATVNRAGVGRFATLDASDVMQVTSLVAEIVERFGSVEAVICTVGPVMAGQALSLSQEDWQAALAANLFPLFSVCAAVVPVMKRARRGSLVNLGSVSASQTGSVSRPDHGAFKLVALSWMKRLATELAPMGIRVNTVSPGIVESVSTEYEESIRAVGRNATPHFLRELCAEKVPLSRPATPDEVARVAVFVASSAASYLTGQNVIVDGGYCNQVGAH